MANLYGSLCLTDIPKELITEGKNGKKYLNIVINERREVSKYGFTHYVKASVRKEQAQAGRNYYIGDLKESEYPNNGNNADAAAAPSTQGAAQNNDGLPF